MIFYAEYHRRYFSGLYLELYFFLCPYRFWEGGRDRMVVYFLAVPSYPGLNCADYREFLADERISDGDLYRGTYQCSGRIDGSGESRRSDRLAGDTEGKDSLHQKYNRNLCISVDIQNLYVF